VEPGAAPIDLSVSLGSYYNPLVRRLRELPKPIVCAVNGVAAGAGANLALACDIVLAAKSASFIEAFCKLGLIPDTGGTWHLPRLIGHARATGLAMLGEKLGAERAEQWGLIWKAVPDEELMNEAMAMARHFASAPTKGLAFTKHALQASWGNTLAEQLKLEGEMMRELGYSHDYREGVDAFINRRAPNFKGE
jgi:2-(1,2-epoxy-1,2-dihydrophenyl)acetyl-CoA isomerase